VNFHWYVIAKYYPELLDGLAVTLEYTAISIVTSFLLGVLVASVIALQIRMVHRILKWYVVFFRETPLLVQIYFVYYALPEFGLTLSAGISAILAITLCEGAFCAEIIRGGIEAVPRGQYDAGRALALSRFRVLRHVVIPQALRNVIPSLVGQSSVVFKDTSLLSIVAITELTAAAEDINAALIDPLTTFLTAGAMYVVVFWILNMFSSLLERRLRMAGRRA
jgi:His/Glu/Gln/Arg/opine family amino acid ABC transporter permease subunit